MGTAPSVSSAASTQDEANQPTTVFVLMYIRYSTK